MTTEQKQMTSKEKQINYFKMYLSSFENGSREYELIKEVIHKLEKTLQ
ncbi:MAG TPA: hypothetical protein PK573_03445 [Spirochaetota bacterium]|nr:hypothetical protein [Spirochaetota bacterium]HRZ26179.1 hypothetical protein [Spirochaetota bacterium]